MTTHQQDSDAVFKSSREKQGRFLPDEEFPLIEIQFQDNLFIVPSSFEFRDLLYKTFCFGRYCGEELILSPYEVFFIKEVCNSISNLPFSVDELWNICCSFSRPEVFAKQYFVYRYYRTNMWVVRDGSVFGSQFVLYLDHPDLVHSSFLVNIIDDWSSIQKECLMESRIAWSLVKKCIICVIQITKKDIDYSSPKCLESMRLEAMDVKRLKFR